jgi:alkylation response protein AidB-like acyl-CoA dehydrogenase
MRAYLSTGEIVVDFGLNEDQETLAKYARDFLTKECPTTFVRKMLDDETALDTAFYKKMAELGWMGIAIPEQFGGQGMSYVDLAVLLEEMGRALVPGPFFASVCMAAPVVLEAGSDAQKKEILTGIASGERNATLAYTESARADASSIELSAREGDGAYTLNGTKRFVLDAQIADTLIVAARTSESGDPTQGVTLFVVDAKAPGITVTQLNAMDMTRRLCDVSFDGVKVTAAAILGSQENGWRPLERALLKATGMLCAESVGGAQKVLDMSVEYAKERIQFGRPIGSFQAVKHKCAEMLVDVELGRSAMYYAAWAASEDDAELPLAASMAKAFCGDAFTRVASTGIHVHGGIGFTWEHDMHLYFKRAKANEVFLGDPTHHRDLVTHLVDA